MLVMYGPSGTDGDKVHDAVRRLPGTPSAVCEMPSCLTRPLVSFPPASQRTISRRHLFSITINSSFSMLHSIQKWYMRRKLFFLVCLRDIPLGAGIAAPKERRCKAVTSKSSHKNLGSAPWSTPKTIPKAGVHRRETRRRNYSRCVLDLVLPGNWRLFPRFAVALAQQIYILRSRGPSVDSKSFTLDSV